VESSQRRFAVLRGARGVPRRVMPRARETGSSGRRGGGTALASAGAFAGGPMVRRPVAFLVAAFLTVTFGLSLYGL